MITFISIIILTAIILAIYSFVASTSTVKEKKQISDSLRKKEQKIFLLEQQMSFLNVKLEHTQRDNSALKSQLFEKEKECLRLREEVAKLNNLLDKKFLSAKSKDKKDIEEIKVLKEKS